MTKKKILRFRCITLNLAGLKFNWFEEREKKVIEGLRRYKPDVVCLQESTICHERAIYHQARALGDALGLRSVAFSPYGNPIEVMSREHGGVATISRWPMITARNRRLPPGRDNPPDARVALLVGLQTPFGELNIATTHLSWKADESEIRMVQCGLILESLEPKTLLLGDFNAAENEPAIHLAREHLKDVYREFHKAEPGWTWTTDNPYVPKEFDLPNRRIDYIFCPPQVRVLDARRILDGSEADFVSDHAGVLADLEWVV